MGTKEEYGEIVHRVHVVLDQHNYAPTDMLTTISVSVRPFVRLLTEFRFPVENEVPYWDLTLHYFTPLPIKLNADAPHRT